MDGGPSLKLAGERESFSRSPQPVRTPETKQRVRDRGWLPPSNMEKIKAPNKGALASASRVL